MMPIVNGIERQYRGQLGVVYASLDHRDGKELAKRHGVWGTPTLLLLDSEGGQVSVLRGSLPAPLIEQAVADLVSR